MVQRFSKLLDQRKEAKLQWLQDRSEINGDNLNNVIRKESRNFRNNKREYLIDKINELATNSKNKNIRDLYRGMNVFKRGYQPRNNLVKMRMSICLQILAKFGIGGRTAIFKVIERA
jgi:hypothetical protein